MEAMAAVGQEHGRGDDEGRRRRDEGRRGGNERRRGGDDDAQGKRLPGLEVGIVVGEGAGEEEEVAVGELSMVELIDVALTSGPADLNSPDIYCKKLAPLFLPSSLFLPLLSLPRAIVLLAARSVGKARVNASRVRKRVWRLFSP